MRAQSHSGGPNTAILVLVAIALALVAMIAKGGIGFVGLVLALLFGVISYLAHRRAMVGNR